MRRVTRERQAPKLEDWVWCERYGCRLVGHRDALDGSPDKPICTAEHLPLAVVRPDDQPVPEGTAVQEPTEAAPTVGEDGTPLPKYRHAITLLVDSYGVDEHDSLQRALAALRVPSGPFRHSTDVVRGPGQRWMCEAEVVHAQGLMSRELDGV